MTPGFLGLGSNLADRRAALQAAVGALAAHGVRALASSSVYESDPVGLVRDQPAFLNAALRVEADVDARGILEAAQAAEAAAGRDRGPGAVRHGPRALDVDVLLLEGTAVDEDDLVVPHPALLERRFVLVGLLELDLALTTPAGASLADALLALDPGDAVRRHGPPLAV